MGLFDWLERPAKQDGPVFEFMDGKRLSPKEYGHCSGQWSFDAALGMLNDFCGSGTPGAALPGGEIIKTRPFVARLYMTTLHIGTYLAYAEHVLQADQAIMVGVTQGVSDFLDCIKDGNGKFLERDDKYRLLQLTGTFSKAVIADINEAHTTDPGVVKPLGVHMQSSKMLLDIIDRSYREADSSRPFLFDGIRTAQYMLGVALLESAPINLLTILKKNFCVHLSSQI